jgi:glycosyltransferase involved in cell wall biosynthesis
MIKLSLCIIVGGNESEEIETLLKSVQGELFDEICVTQTQNDPEVKAVLEKYKVKISWFDWVKNFSSARNYCFSQATNEYVMWLDADDEISPENYEKLLSVKSTLYRYDIVYLNYNYSHFSDGRPSSTLPRERIVKMSQNVKWEGAVHEYLSIGVERSPLKRMDIAIDHRRKRAYDPERNLEILRNQYYSENHSPRDAFYYGKDLYDSGKTEQAIRVLRLYLLEGGDYYQNIIQALLRISDFEKLKSRFESAEKYLREAIDISDEYAEPRFELGLLLEAKKDYKGAKEQMKKALEKSPDGLFASRSVFYNILPLDSLVRLCDKTGDYKNGLMYVNDYLKLVPNDKNFLYNKEYFEGKLDMISNETTDQIKTKSIEKSTEVQCTITEELNLNLRIGYFINNPNPVEPSTRIRRLNVIEELKYSGRDVTLYSNYADSINTDWFANKFKDLIDVAVVCDLWDKSLDLITKLKSVGITVIMDYNEAIHDMSEPVRKMLSSVDGTICCSDVLAGMVKQYSSRISTIPDPVEYDEDPEYDSFLPVIGKPKALYIGMGGNSYLAYEVLKDAIEEAGYDLIVCTEWDNATVKWTLETWRSIMKSCHVVLCPQRVTEQPAKSNIKAVQAMSFGIPVIASPLPAYKEFIVNGKNGYICDKPEEWKNALIELKDMRRRVQIGMNGKETAEDFDLESISSAFYTLFATMHSILHPIVKKKLEITTTTELTPIIIPVYNCCEYLKMCVESIRKNTDTPYKIILSDAGSDSTTRDYMESLVSEGDVIVAGKRGVRQCFSSTVNTGVIAAGKCSNFVILNSDVIVSKGWLKGLLANMSRKDIAACGVLSNCDRGWLNGVKGRPTYNMKLPNTGIELVPAMKLEAISPYLDDLYLFMDKSNEEHYGKFVDQPWVAYYATMISKSAWDKVGGLDPMFQNGCEDLDHCHRLRKMGYNITQAIDSFVFHFGGISRGAYEKTDSLVYKKEDENNHIMLREKEAKKIVAIYTGPAWEPWDRDSVDAGMAGSETWASELGASLVSKGFDVTIFNQCPKSGQIDRYGVRYLNYNTLENWQKYKYVDHYIISRTCEPIKWFTLHSSDISVMIHDVFLNNDRNYDIVQDQVNRYGVLSEWHRDFVKEYHRINHTKLFMTANGVREELYKDVDISKKKNMAVYSSSPDRGLYELLCMLPEIRKSVPDFELVVAYGFYNWKSAATSRNDVGALKRIKEIEEKLKQPGVNYVGRVSKKELAEYQKQSKIWLYPTGFTETFCITLVENGMSRNAAVATPLGGLVTTGGNAVSYINGPGNLHPSTWNQTKEYQDAFLSETIKILTNSDYYLKRSEDLFNQVKNYTWDNAAEGWLSQWSSR